MRFLRFIIWHLETKGYEVKFCGEEGRTIAQLALSGDQFKIESGDLNVVD